MLSAKMGPLGWSNRARYDWSFGFRASSEGLVSERACSTPSTSRIEMAKKSPCSSKPLVEVYCVVAIIILDVGPCARVLPSAFAKSACISPANFCCRQLVGQDVHCSLHAPRQTSLQACSKTSMPISARIAVVPASKRYQWQRQKRPSPVLCLKERDRSYLLFRTCSWRIFLAVRNFA